MSNTILLVDDEPAVLSAISRSLRGESYEIVCELSGEIALERMEQQPFKVVISDERMSRMQGSEFLSIVRKKYPGTVRILLTGHASLDAAIRAVNEGGIYKFLVKPWDDKELKAAAREAISKHDTEQEAWRIFRTLQQKQHDVTLLEMQYPGISCLERDSEGSLILPDLSDEDLDVLRRQCELAFAAGGPALTTTNQVRTMLLQKFIEGEP